MKGIVNLAIEAGKEVGKLLLDNFDKEKRIESKGDRDLVTEIDKKAEEIIVDKIKTKFPSHGILGEEGVRKDLGNDYLWIIDPLDGTHNYIRNINIFGISIGVVYKGDFILGVIYIPGENELYVGEKDNGAYKNGERVYVSQKEELKECSISFDSSIRYSPRPMLGLLDKLAQKVFNIRMLGSSARVLSYIAEGKLDLTVEFNDKPWDFAAGVCLVKEAGGIFTDLKGQSPTYHTVGYIASNKVIYPQVLNLTMLSLKEHL